jgi:homoserine O-succinyltransferase
MPIRVPDNLPALDDLEAEGVDLIASGQATKQDIRPLRLLMLNLMPTKKATEIQFARLFGCSPLQVELILMTTESYTPRNTEPAYLRRFYRRLSDVEDEYFDALIVTGAPIETKPFEEVSYWNELVDILNWSKTHCFRRLGICWGAQALLYHFHNLPKYQMDTKFFGIYNHSITSNSGTSDNLILAGPILAGLILVV